MPAPEEMSRDELIVLVAEQAERIAGLVQANEALAAKLARLEHLLSRNSQNSSSPPSKDGDPGRIPPKDKPGRGKPERARGKQPGARGTNLAWTGDPDDQRDRFPQGRCECGQDLAEARDLGVVDRYQQHEIPQVRAKVTQYDQHAVRCGCGRVHTATRPPGARGGLVGYGPNLQALVVLLLVGQFLPAHRCVQVLQALTGAAPSVGFVHGMLARTADAVATPVARIRALLVKVRAVCCDETPIRIGPRTPRPGRKKAEKYLLVACTDRYTYYLVGDRDLETFKAFVLPDLAAAGSVIVHDRYQVYDCAELGELVHQLCCQHLLRDLAGAAEVYPDAAWPAQIADALRGLIHQTNLARQNNQHAIDPAVQQELVGWFRRGVRVGLSDTAHHGSRPGERKSRLLLETLRDREPDVLRFSTDLQVPPTSNQAERDLRPAKIQQNISGRLTSTDRTQDRYTIRGYLSTAAKHHRKRWLSSWRCGGSGLINLAVHGELLRG